MGQFFVSFSKKKDFGELVDIVRRMNNTNERYNPGAGEAITGLKAKLHDRDGFTIKEGSNHECYMILWRKYFMLSHDENQGVYFFDKDYVAKVNNIKVVKSAVTA